MVVLSMLFVQLCLLRVLGWGGGGKRPLRRGWNKRPLVSDGLTCGSYKHMGMQMRMRWYALSCARVHTHTHAKAYALALAHSYTHGFAHSHTHVLSHSYNHNHAHTRRNRQLFYFLNLHTRNTSVFSPWIILFFLQSWLSLIIFL